MRTLDFNIPCVPPKTTHQASLFIYKTPGGTHRIGKSKKGKGTERELLLLLQPHAPDKPLEGPLELTVAFCWPWRKSEPKKNRAEGCRWNDRRPDSDNLLKFVCDIMGRLHFYNDDAQCSYVKVLRMWGDNPGIAIRLREIGVFPATSRGGL